MEYKTQDIILAACLKVHGFTLDHIIKVGNKGTFVFTDVSSEFLMDYDLDKILVSPITFNNTIKQLTTSVRRMQSS